MLCSACFYDGLYRPYRKPDGWVHPDSFEANRVPCLVVALLILVLTLQVIYL